MNRPARIRRKARPQNLEEPTSAAPHPTLRPQKIRAILVEAVTGRVISNHSVPSPFVLKILVSKIFGIKILQTHFCETRAAQDFQCVRGQGDTPENAKFALPAGANGEFILEVNFTTRSSQCGKP
jgi:hypothetical protein